MAFTRKWLGFSVPGIIVIWMYSMPIAAQSQSGVGKPVTRDDEQPAGSSHASSTHFVEIKREPLRLTEPKEYAVSLQLRPVQSLDLAAPVNGFVQIVHQKKGEKILARSEAIRFENRAQQLMVDRASARFRAAEIQLRQATEQGKSSSMELAQARFDAAKAELELAKLQLEQTKVLAPFTGTVVHVYVTEGQFVRAGDPLMTLVDPSQLQVALPIDRTQLSQGQEIEFQVEDRTVQATIEQISAPIAPFEPLRGLTVSLASATVVLDNSQGQFQLGQAVYAPLVPRLPVAEVPTVCLSSLPSGQRRVQVVRDQMVRDITVELLGQVGHERIFVSGAFGPADEVIVRTSRELTDGTVVRPASLNNEASEVSPHASQAERPLPTKLNRQQPGF